MQLRIFNRRREEIRKQAGQIPPGQLTENNSVIINMAAKYVRYFLAASAAAVVIVWYLIGQVEPGGKAHETLMSSATIIAFGVVALAVIFSLFKAAEWCEARAKAMDDRDDPTDPDFPPRIPVRRLMERAIFMIQLGYRLVVFAGVCIVVGVVYIFKGLFAM